MHDVLKSGKVQSINMTPSLSLSLTHTQTLEYHLKLQAELMCVLWWKIYEMCQLLMSAAGQLSSEVKVTHTPRDAAGRQSLQASS